MEVLILKFAHMMALLLQAYTLVIAVRIVASWMNPFPPRGGPLALLYAITDPYLNIFRNLFPFLAMGGIDFSPILGIVLLQFLARWFAGVGFGP